MKCFKLLIIFVNSFFLFGCILPIKEKPVEPQMIIEIPSISKTIEISQIIAMHQATCTKEPSPVKFDKQQTLNQRRQLEALQLFFSDYCNQSEKQPDALIEQLDKLKTQYTWSTENRDYLNLLSWHLSQFSVVNQKNETLQRNMQKTLSALAKVEQQLLTRDFEDPKKNDISVENNEASKDKTLPENKKLPVNKTQPISSKPIEKQTEPEEKSSTVKEDK